MTQAEKDAAVTAAVVREARTWLGTPYRHQGSRKGVGCDCLGLVRGVWRALYGNEPEQPGPYAPDWAEAGGRDDLLSAARRHCRELAREEVSAGRLLIFRWRRGFAAKHVGIALDASSFIHAYQGHAVLVSALVPHWRARIAGVFAFPYLSDAPEDQG